MSFPFINVRNKANTTLSICLANFAAACQDVAALRGPGEGTWLAKEPTSRLASRSPRKGCLLVVFPDTAGKSRHFLTFLLALP